MGASSSAALKRAIKFYSKFMNPALIHTTSLAIAELCKPLENAYRFYEIAFAEELKMLCDRKKLDFELLRKAMNTKWNIDIKRARNGIGGHCLPKDIQLIRKFFPEFKMIKMAIEIDGKYKSVKK